MPYALCPMPLTVLSFLFVLFGVFQPAWGAETWLVNANKLTLEYRQKLDTLAKWCDEHDLPKEAGKIRRCVPPQADDKIYIPQLPTSVLRASSNDKETSETSDSEENDDFDWETELWKTRRTYAAKLFTCAKAAAKQDRGTLAIQMSLAALQADPDHEKIRKLLGFVQYKNEWRTPWEAEQLKKGYIDHPRFGWIPEKNVKRYEAGERLYGKKWISEGEDRYFHGQDVRKGWVIESEHYILTTNHSMEEGVRLSRKLEDLYRAWKLLFYRYMASDEGLASLFEGKSSPKAGPKDRKHQIFVFRNQEDYKTSLAKEKPEIAETIGLYTFKRCYFFSVDSNSSRQQKEDVDRTLLHEATHQLFEESRHANSSIAEKENFWIIEGIAMYMETLRSEEEYYVVGGTGDIRFRNAIAEALREDFYVPLELLVKLGRPRFQGGGKLQEIYAQSAGMTHFLMHAENGTFRDATIQYLRLIYEGKDDPDTLRTLTKRSYEDLDEMYRKYLNRKQMVTQNSQGIGHRASGIGDK
ncbi:MAG: DUF1570 domain-containing protein [Planctomycetaceae bacterium]|nr:DUF1570 domain-containing protein [Planctomycetaceae bacterium]